MVRETPFRPTTHTYSETINRYDCDRYLFIFRSPLKFRCRQFFSVGAYCCSKSSSISVFFFFLLSLYWKLINYVLLSTLIYSKNILTGVPRAYIFMYRPSVQKSHPGPEPRPMKQTYKRPSSENLPGLKIKRVGENGSKYV